MRENVYPNRTAVVDDLNSTKTVLCCTVLSYCRVWLCATPWRSPPGFSVYGDSPGKNAGVGCHAFLQGIFLTQRLNPNLPHCRRILYCPRHLGSPGLSNFCFWVPHTLVAVTLDFDLSTLLIQYLLIPLFFLPEICCYLPPAVVSFALSLVWGEGPYH